MTYKQFPLVVANGGSQLSAAWYSEFLGADIKSIFLCSHHFAQALGGYCVELARPGSSNRRIIRRTVIECLRQRQLNPDQPVIALIELGIDMRSELWLESLPHLDADESNFHSVPLGFTKTWWHDLRSKHEVKPENRAAQLDIDVSEQKFVDKWQESAIYFYSPYAATINLYLDVLMMTALFRGLDINYLVYRSVPAQVLDDNHVIKLLQQQLAQDPGVIDLEHTSFNGWSLDQGHEPLDRYEDAIVGHPNLQAHQDWAALLLEKYQQIYG